MKPSKYQSAIMDWARSSSDSFLKGDNEGLKSLVVIARAGSGKTTLCVDMLTPIFDSRGLEVQLVAFNKSTANTFKDKLKQNPEISSRVTAGTNHSAGLKACREAWGRSSKIKVDGKKDRAICKEIFDICLNRGRIGNRSCPEIAEQLRSSRGSASYPLGKIFDLARQTMAPGHDPEQSAKVVRDIVFRHGIEIENEHWDFIQQALPVCYSKSLAMAENHGILSFTDMIFFPASRDEVVPYRNDVVIVDECQDLNACQRRLVQKMVKPDGILVFVGDDKQAIYGFAGADTESVSKIIEETNAEEMPLSICYRCDSSILDEARKIVPDIEDRPGAPKGEVLNLSTADMLKVVKPGDMIMCRVNAPIVRLCYLLIRMGVPAFMRGRSIGSGLQSAVRQVVKRRSYRKWEDFGKELEGWADDSVKKLLSKGAEHGDAAIINIEDKHESLLAVFENTRPKSVDSFLMEIEVLFSEGLSKVCLSSVHQAKGQESERCFIYGPDLLPHPMAKRPWQVEQEMNLLYVARTRAMSTLAYTSIEAIDMEQGQALTAIRRDSGLDLRAKVAPSHEDHWSSIAPPKINRR